MAKLITPQQLQDAYNELPTEQLITDPRILELRKAVIHNVGLAASYQPMYDDISDLIDSARNQQFLQHSGKPNAKF